MTRHCSGGQEAPRREDSLQRVTQRLLAQRAARECSVKVSEDELLAEVRTVAADEWEQARRIESNSAAKGELTCSSSKPATTGIRTGARPGAVLYGPGRR